jgi:hypothetical protein
VTSSEPAQPTAADSLALAARAGIHRLSLPTPFLVGRVNCYLIEVDPPENVLVVSIDEKTGIQAKSPTKPDVPPAPGKPARREHEYTRNGTQCLFACLNVNEGDVLAMPSKTRNRFDLIRFLDMLEEEIPVVEGQEIVAVSDNLATRGTEEVQQWLKDHPRWRFQFTPTHASWLNQVESSFQSCGGDCSRTASSPPSGISPSRCSRS